MSVRVLNFQAIAVDWVALVSCTHRERRRRGLQIRNPVPGADSGAFVYWGSRRWVEVVCTDGLSLTQVSKMLTSRALGSAV